MSLVTDPAFLGAALRLDYLRKVRDPASPRILSVPAAPTAYAPIAPQHPLTLHRVPPRRPVGTDVDSPTHHRPGLNPTDDPFTPGQGSDQPLPLPESLSNALTGLHSNSNNSNNCADGGAASQHLSPLLEMSRLTDPAAFPALKLLDSPPLEPMPLPSPPAVPSAPTSSVGTSSVQPPSLQQPPSQTISPPQRRDATPTPSHGGRIPVPRPPPPPPAPPPGAPTQGTGAVPPPPAKPATAPGQASVPFVVPHFRPNTAADARRAARRERIAKMEAAAQASKPTAAGPRGPNTTYNNPFATFTARPPGITTQTPFQPPAPILPKRAAEPLPSVEGESGGSASAPFPQTLPGEQSEKELVASRRRSGSSPVNSTIPSTDTRKKSSAATIAASAVAAAQAMSSNAPHFLHRPGAQPSGSGSSLGRRGTLVVPPSARGTPLTATPEMPTEEGGGTDDLPRLPQPALSPGTTPGAHQPGTATHTLTDSAAHTGAPSLGSAAQPPTMEPGSVPASQSNLDSGTGSAPSSSSSSHSNSVLDSNRTPSIQPKDEGIAYSLDGDGASSLYPQGNDLSPPRVAAVQAAAERKCTEANARKQRWSQTQLAFGAEALAAINATGEVDGTKEERGDATAADVAQQGKEVRTGPTGQRRQASGLFGKVPPSTVRNRLDQAQSGPSALSRRLRSADEGPRNPFAALYACTAARSAVSAPSVSVQLYFPWSTPTDTSPKSTVVSEVDPHSKSMVLRVRKDATIEELIGFGLFCYMEEQWGPLPSKISGWSGTDADQLTTVGWELRMVEDGDVDDDFPAFDRALTLTRFNAKDNAEFAVVPAGPEAVAANKAQFAQIQRRATRVIASDQAPALDTGGAQAVQGSGGAQSLGGVPSTPLGASLMLGKSVGAMGSTGTMTFLRVLITPSREVRYTTTVQVPAEMYLADVLELICRKRQLSSPSEWALVAHSQTLPPAALASGMGEDGHTVAIPLDRTVASLQGQRDLTLVRRSSLAIKDAALTSLSTDPNAPIFGADASYTKPGKLLSSIYKTWTVNRKTAMFVGRHEQRTLTLDGDWLHLTPADMRAFNARMVSYPLDSITTCGLSSKGRQFVKLIVEKDARSAKRYDFEAQSANEAADIVQSINTVRRSLGQRV